MSQRLNLIAGRSAVEIARDMRGLVGWSEPLVPRADLKRQACALALIGADVASFAISLGMIRMATGEVSAVLDSTHGTQAWLTSAFILSGLLLVFFARGHYTRRLPFWLELQQVLSASALSLLCNSFVEFAFKTDASRMVVLGTWIMFPAVSALFRFATRIGLAKVGLWQIRTVIVSDGEAARTAAEALESEQHLGYSVIRTVRPGDVSTRMDRPWTRLLQQSRADLLILAPERDQTLDRARNEALVRERVPFAVMPHTEGLPVSGFEQTYFFRHDLVLLSYRNNISQPLARAAKIALDLAGAAALVLFTAPVFLLIAWKIRQDGGPVFFAHPRVGSGGRVFPCLKFRSMRVDSAEILDDLLRHDQAAAVEWAATQKLRHDPRITPIGEWLRKTSLDELPQLLNVLRLQMSLVGPRPIVESEKRHYGEDIAFYYETRPGLTGLWQVSGRSDTTYRQRVQLDSWYVKNWTLWHDIAILAKTIPAVMQRRGAV